MLMALYDYFYAILTNNIRGSSPLGQLFAKEIIFDFGGNTFNMAWSSYLSFILAFISFAIIVVLCCLFIGKIIKTIGRLFSGGTL